MKNILLVEDEYLIAQAEKMSLQAEGYTVTHVGRGEDAVSAALAPDADFDIVLMDVNLGSGIDGPEAARRILAERDLPVIFLSSHTEKQVVELTRGVGSYGYIPKSAGTAVLNASLRMAFKLAQAHAHLREREAMLEDTVIRLQKTDSGLKRELEINASLGIIAHEIFARGLSIQYLSDIVLQEARKLTRSEHGYVARVDPSTGDLISYTLSRMIDERCAVQGSHKHIVFPRGPDGLYAGLWGWTLNEKAPRIVNDPASHPARTGIPPGHIPIRNFLGFPIVRNGILIGQIALANKEGEYSQEDLEVVGRISDLYGLLLERVDREETERLLSRILTAAEDAVVVLDLAGRVLFWNPSAERIFGRKADAVLGREADFLPGDRDALSAQLARIAAAQDPVRESKILVDAEGRRFPARLTWAPIGDESGRAEAVSLVFTKMNGT